MRCCLALLCIVAVSGCANKFQSDVGTVYRAVATDPHASAGELYAFSGRVIEAEQTGQEFVLQLSVDPKTPVLLARYPGTGRLAVTVGEMASVLGFIRGGGRGVNAFGGEVRSVEMDGIAFLGQSGGQAVSGWESYYESWKDGTLSLPASLSVMK